MHGRRQRLEQIEQIFGVGRVFIAENAWEEIETWILAGLDLPATWRWNNIRAEVHVKERYFEPLAQSLSVADGPGGGRKALGQQAAAQTQVIMQKCPEDFGRLAQRLEEAIR